MKTDKSILERYFQDGMLTIVPSKHTAKVQVMEYIITFIEPQRVYTEKEVNELIKPIYHDFAIIRRYLIDFRLLSRSKDGKEYWVTEK